MVGKRRVIRIFGVTSTRLRYGRATLTVAHGGDLITGDLGEAIAAYERGEMNSEELGERFARVRVRAHSPSFNWEEADRQRVLDLVVEASQEPRFESSESSHVAKQLVAAADEERRALKTSIGQLRSRLAPRLKVENLVGGGRRDALVGGTWIGLNTEIAKAFGDRRQSFLGSSRLLDSVRAQACALNRFGLGPGYDMPSNHFKGLGAFGMKAIDPKLFETAGWVRKLPDPAPWLRGLKKQFGSWVEAMKQALPANWRDLESDELEQIVELMQVEGLNLAWAPREELVRKLVAAETHADRCEVLIRHRDEIIEDVQGVLRSIGRADLRPVAEAGFEAIRTYRDGHPAPAQTYAAAAVGEVLHGSLGYETFGEVKRTFREKNPIHDVGFRDFPLFAVGHALARTLDRFKDAGDGFNRNLTSTGSVHLTVSPIC